MAWKGRGVVTPSRGGVHATHSSRTQVTSSRKRRSSGTTPCSAASTLLLHTRDAVVATRRRRRERVGARCESSDSPPTGSSRAGAALPAPHEEGAAPHGRRDDGGALGLVEGESVSKSQDVYLSLSGATDLMAGKTASEDPARSCARSDLESPISRLNVRKASIRRGLAYGCGGRRAAPPRSPRQASGAQFSRRVRRERRPEKCHHGSVLCVRCAIAIGFIEE